MTHPIRVMHLPRTMPEYFCPACCSLVPREGLCEPCRDRRTAEAIVRKMVEAAQDPDWDDRPVVVPPIPRWHLALLWLLTPFVCLAALILASVAWLNHHHPRWLLWLALAAVGVIAVVAASLWIGWTR